MKFLSRLVEFKILVNWGMVHSNLEFQDGIIIRNLFLFKLFLNCQLTVVVETMQHRLVRLIAVKTRQFSITTTLTLQQKVQLHKCVAYFFLILDEM
jgi:hypothetical protein